MKPTKMTDDEFEQHEAKETPFLDLFIMIFEDMLENINTQEDDETEQE